MTAVSHCPRCGKRVFFAERKTSLGRDWHRQCLTCEACKKVLNPGQHSEHKGIPYCEVPCYKSLFGPKLYGFGSTVESHTFKGTDTWTGVTERETVTRSSRRETPQVKIETTDSEKFKDSTSNKEVDRKSTATVNFSMNSPRIEGRGPKLNDQQIVELQEKCDVLNTAFPERYITLIQKDGYATLEGPLRIHWGVQTSITFRQDNSSSSSPFTARIAGNTRLAKSRSFHHNQDEPTNNPAVVRSADPFGTLRKSGMDSPQVTSQQLLAVKMRRDKFHTIKLKKLSRRSSFNGHYYKPETSDANFTPAFGSVSNVYAASHLRTPQVIKRLLLKFHVENDASQFSLYLVKQNGEMWALAEDQQPLMERVQFKDLTARMFLMDKPDHLNNSRHHSSVADQPTDKMDNLLVSASAEVNSSRAIEPSQIESKEPSNVTREISSVWRPVEKPDVSKEVASFLGLPEAVLQGFLRKFTDDEAMARKKIEDKYVEVRRTLVEIMATKQLEEATFL